MLWLTHGWLSMAARSARSGMSRISGDWAPEQDQICVHLDHCCWDLLAAVGENIVPVPKTTVILTGGGLAAFGDYDEAEIQ